MSVISVKDIWKSVIRERAVIAGFLAAALQAVAVGELTKATAIPVLSGLILRFFVEPYKGEGDEADVSSGNNSDCSHGPAADPSIPPLPMPEELTGLFDDEEEGAVEDV